MSVQYLTYTLKNNLPLTSAIPETPWNRVDKNLITIPVRHWDFIMEDLHQELPDEVDWQEDYFMSRDEDTFEYPHDPELKKQMIGVCDRLIEKLQAKKEDYYPNHEKMGDLWLMNTSVYINFIRSVQIVFREALEKNAEVVAEIY
jgi:hypothetical protein